MSSGQGSITVNQKTASGGGGSGPPFAANSANNGLSVNSVSGRIVLGQDIGAVGDPAQLLSNREIPLNGFNLFVGSSPTEPFIKVDATGSINNQTPLLTAITSIYSPNQPFFVADHSNGVYQLGDINGNDLHGDYLSVNAITRHIQFFDQLAPIFDLAPGSDSYSIGDYTIATTGTRLVLTSTDFNVFSSGQNVINTDRIGGIYKFGDISNNKYLNINSIASNDFTYLHNNNPYLLIDVSNDLYVLGDYNAIIKNTNLSLSSTAFIVTSNGSGIIDTNHVTNTYQFGDLNNGDKLLINSVSNQLFGYTSSFNTYLLLDVSNNFYGLGSITLGASFLIFDPVNLVEFAAFGSTGQQLLKFDNANDLTINTSGNFLLKTNTTLVNNAAANVGTLTNAPAAGNPTKWIAIDDNGTTRYIPTW